jgi:serine/threonine protein kinase/predicted Zn-dependent protease
VTSVGPEGTDTRDEELLADLFDRLLQDILEGRTPDLEQLHPERPDLRERIAKTWHLACSVAGRREPSRPVLGGYEVLRELGHGGMGTVYLARHQTLQRDVAVKVLPHSLAMSPRAKQRFLEEARALAQIRHENVVHIHRIIDHAEMLAFEMEFVDGPSLDKLIRTLAAAPKPFALASLVEALGHGVDAGVRSSVEWYVRVFIRIARALAEVHRHGLVHRDVKPSNILLRSDGTPVLADFGLALQGDLDATRTRFAGTPVYAAPERLRGGDGTVDARTDIYSLGVTLYEALTSSPPFAGSSSAEVLRRIENGAAPPLRQRAPHVSRDLAIVIQKAMEPDPRHRYATADEFADDLERLLSLQPIHARPPGPARRVFQFVRRHQRVVVAALASAVFVALALWPLAAHASSAAAAKDRSAAALQRARSQLLCPEALPASWSPQAADGLELRRSTAETARAGAFARSLAQYDEALAATPDDAMLRLEREVVAAVAALRGRTDPGAPLPKWSLPPACDRLAKNAGAHRPLGAELDETLASAGGEDRFAAGLFAFLWGDYATSTTCWEKLPPALDENALCDACASLQLAEEGAPERAYPRLFHAARAFPEARALAFALADAALATGDLPLAKQWIQALPAADAADTRRRLLAADMLAAEGDWEGAAVGYRQLRADDATDPLPQLRLAMMALRTGNRAAAKSLLRQLLARWPDLAVARRQLARLALQERDLAGYLAHARRALDQMQKPATPARSDLCDVLRLGDLQALYSQFVPPGARGRGVRRDDVIPLTAWLRSSHVAGIEQALRLAMTVDAAAEQAAIVDPRPVGTALRAAWSTALELPQLTARLPIALQAALLCGMPLSFGEVADWIGLLLTPYQSTLGARLHVVENPSMFTRALEPDDLFGTQILRVDDLDGDTLPELCFASPSSAQNPGAGSIEIRSAIDGRLLRTWTHGDENAMFARCIASLGDVDGDLCDDILIGIPLGRKAPDAVAAVELWSGRRGTMLWRLEDSNEAFGASLAALGDIDGDGVRDAVIGRPPVRLDGDRPGAAFVISGRTGALLHTLEPERDDVWFGAAVADAGDVNGDGIDDIVVGGNYGNAPGLVTVFDGRTGAMLTSFTDTSTTTDFGASVLGAGDLDGDGRSEIVVTAPSRSSRGVDAGKVLVLSSRTGKSLYELHGERPNEWFGASILRLPDWTGNGRPALAVGAAMGGPIGNGYLRVFDLASAAPLQTFAGNAAMLRFGYACADLGTQGRLRRLGALSLAPEGATFFTFSFADAYPVGDPRRPH